MSRIGVDDGAVLRDRLPELVPRIVGGLGVLLLSPTVLTAASRSRLAASPEPGRTATDGPGSKSQENNVPSSDVPRSDLRMRIAMIASGLAAATAIVYTAPGTPWARADVLSPPPAPAAAAADDGAGTAMDMEHDSATLYSGVIRTADRTVLVDAVPATAGINTVAITALDAKNVPVNVVAWSATASLPGRPAVTVPLKGFGDGVASADADLPAAGSWTFKITIRAAGADPTTYTHVVPIGPAG
jgi:hypothetical protein